MKKNNFKKFLIVILCICMQFDSMAAISVSDGSAFVSKAEFAADLNSLSNRMAQLENSLDAKIDSLVSSYLTRNGIWSASNQEITSAVNNHTYSFTPGWRTGNRGTLFEQTVSFADTIVARTNKAGMVFGSFSYGNKHQGNANNWYFGGFNRNTSHDGWIWDQNMCVTLSFYITDMNVNQLTFDTDGNITNGELKSVFEVGKSLGKWNWDSTGVSVLVAIPMPNWNTQNFVFFIDADQKIWWRWLNELSSFKTTDWSNMTAEGSTMRVKLNNLSIY